MIYNATNKFERAKMGIGGDLAANHAGWLIRAQVWSAAVLCQELFYFHGSGAAGAGCGDRLAIAAVLHVTAGKDAGDVRKHEIVGLEVAILVHIELALEHLCVGYVANAQEHGASREVPYFAGLLVAQVQCGDLFLADVVNFFDYRIEQELDLLVLAGAVKHDLRRAEVMTPMNDCPLRRKAGQEKSFFHS